MAEGDEFGACACGGRLRETAKRDRDGILIGKCIVCRAEYGEGFRPGERGAAPTVEIPVDAPIFMGGVPSASPNVASAGSLAHRAGRSR